jgi:C4-dicarboxylate transporter DctM subunit
MAGLLFGLLALMLAIGIPIGVSLGISLMGVLFLGNFTHLFPVIPQRMFTTVDNFPFMAIPLFIFAGNLMSEGGMSKRMLRFVEVLLRRKPIALANTTTGASIFFGAISGSNPATVAAIGGLTIPYMKKKGYPSELAGAVAAASGTVGVIIPPSIPMVTYAVTANVSVGTMFLCGIIPGLMVGLTIMIVNRVVCIKYEPANKDAPRLPLKELLLAFREAGLTLLMPIIILGGIYGGVFTPTEAASVACVYAFVISMFIYKEIKVADLFGIIVKSARNSAIILFVISLPGPFGWFMTNQSIPAAIANTVLGTFSSKIAILFFINAVLLFLGFFLETQVVILLMTPILLPIGLTLGLSPYVLGLIIVINTSIGMITPPMAVNLFVASSISQATIERISKKIVPYLTAEIIILLAFTYFPQIITFIPKLLGVDA